MSILPHRRSRIVRPPQPTDKDIIVYLDAIRAESIADLDAAHLPPAVDVQAQTDSWEYDKRFRPGVFRRRVLAIETRAGGEAA
jgi:hypothetical protein